MSTAGFVLIGVMISLSAQPAERPDFSGRWIRAEPGASGSQPALVLEVQQTPKSLVVADWARGSKPLVHEIGPATSWQGERLIIKHAQRTETWSIDRQGFLVIEEHELRRRWPSHSIRVFKKADPE